VCNQALANIGAGLRRPLYLRHGTKLSGRRAPVGKAAQSYADARSAEYQRAARAHDGVHDAVRARSSKLGRGWLFLDGAAPRFVSHEGPEVAHVGGRVDVSARGLVASVTLQDVHGPVRLTMPRWHARRLRALLGDVC
jgi:hypothetical protein